MPAEGLSGFYGSVFKRSTTAATLIRTGDGRALALRSGTGRWELPGGVARAGEDPRSAARRVARRALDPGFEIGRLLVVDYVQNEPGRGDAIAFLYDGGTLATSVTSFTGAGGDHEVRFIPFAECLQVLGQASGRRVAGALQALELGTVTELVDAEPVQAGPAARPPAEPLMPALDGFKHLLGGRP